MHLKVTHQWCNVTDDADAISKVWQIISDINAVNPHFEVKNQRICVARVLQDQFPDVGHFVGWVAFLVVSPEVEATVIDAVSDQGVVTVSLEVIFLLVKGDIVRITPHLTVTRFWNKYDERSER